MARPKPLLLRILQNPNFYAFLIGGVLVSAAFYIFLNPRTVSRQMSALLRGHFVLSKSAGDPNDSAAPSEARSRNLQEEETAAPEDKPAASENAAAAPKETTPFYSQMEIAFFELSRENLMALQGKILRDEGDWHVVYYDDAKTIESLQAAARKLPGIQEKALQKENTQMDAGDVEPDLRSPYLAVGVEWIKGETLHWALDLQLPPPATSNRALAQAENAAASASDTPAAAASATTAAAAPLQLTALEGNVHFTPQSALLLVYDPAIRTFPGLESAAVNKSPLRVLASEDFRAGFSALVVWIRLK